MQRLPLIGWRGSYLILAPYLVALVVDHAVGPVVMPWPSAWAWVPRWFDLLALMVWAVVGAVVGRDPFVDTYVGHVVGMALVAVVIGFRYSSIDTATDRLGAAVLFGFVVVIAKATWAIAGVTARRQAIAPSSPAYGLILAWSVFPYVVIGLRWLG